MSTCWRAGMLALHAVRGGGQRDGVKTGRTARLEGGIRGGGASLSSKARSLSQAGQRRAGNLLLTKDRTD